MWANTAWKKSQHPPSPSALHTVALVLLTDPEGEDSAKDEPDVSTVLGNVLPDEFVALDNGISTSETLNDNWEEAIFRAA